MALKETARSDIHTMLPKAVKVVDYKLNKKSLPAAVIVLKATGILAPDAAGNVGIFSAQADVDIKGLIELAGESSANCAPVASESSADAEPGNGVLPDKTDTETAK